MGEFNDDDSTAIVVPEGSGNVPEGQEGVIRVRLPRNNEIFGILDRRLGGSRCNVRCLDGKTRICRIPGRLKRKLWVREGDLVLVEPWEFGGDEKGDIIYKYRGIQIDWLKKNHHLDKLQELDEF
jgi:translation initiation factor 1A